MTKPDMMAELAEVVDTLGAWERTSADEYIEADFYRERFKVKASAFLRTHHAELEAVVRKAQRYDWLRTRDVTFETEDGGEFVSFVPELGCDGSKLDAAIDAAMHNSAREGMA